MSSLIANFCVFITLCFFSKASIVMASDAIFTKIAGPQENISVRNRVLSEQEFNELFLKIEKEFGDRTNVRKPDEFVEYTVVLSEQGEEVILQVFTISNYKYILPTDFKVLDVTYDKKDGKVFLLYINASRIYLSEGDVATKKRGIPKMIFRESYDTFVNKGTLSKGLGKSSLSIELSLEGGTILHFKEEGSEFKLSATEVAPPKTIPQSDTTPNSIVEVQEEISKASPYDEATVWSKYVLDSPVMGVGAFVSRQRINREPIEDSLHDLLPGEEMPSTKVIDRYVWKSSIWSDVDGWIMPELWVQEVEFDAKNPVTIEVLDMNYKFGSPVLSTIYKKAGSIYANVIRTNEQGQPLKMVESDMLLPLNGDELNVISALLEGSIESPKVVLSYAGEKKVTFFLKEGKWVRAMP